jgi:hypothetical protein
MRISLEGRIGETGARMAGMDIGGMRGSNDLPSPSIVGSSGGDPIFDVGAFGDVVGGLGQI